jgi:hypothetical protein
VNIKNIILVLLTKSPKSRENFSTEKKLKLKFKISPWLDRKYSAVKSAKEMKFTMLVP